jgi:signal transduction histidine kinase
MQKLGNRLIIATGLGTLLTLGSYVVEQALQRAGKPHYDTLIDNLLVGIIGALLAFVWATLLAERESRRRFAEAMRLEAVTEERNRLAREIHDTLAQGLTGVLLQLEATQFELAEDTEAAQARLQRAQKLARESLAEVRRSLWAMRPQALEQGGLGNALSVLAERLMTDPKSAIQCSLHGTPVPLPPEVEHQFMRIGQEAMTNAVKHARAKKVSVELRYTPSQVTLVVQDDGRGFDPEAPSDGHGFGLRGMQERAGHMGAELTVHSQPGMGTRVVATLPLPTPTPQLNT